MDKKVGIVIFIMIFCLLSIVACSICLAFRDVDNPVGVKLTAVSVAGYSI